MKLSRRDIGAAAMLAGLSLGSGDAGAESLSDGPVKGPRPSSDPSFFTKIKGGERIAMVLYPGMTALDLIGPHWFFQTMKGAKVDMVAATREPVLCDRNVTLTPTATFDEMPKDLDVLFVPGAGFGTLKAMDDDRLLDFLADRGERARYVTAVCTGPLVLGAAGLLEGYRATAHWKVRDTVLPKLGAIPVDARYVVDRNRITGGGVTAGIDFGLHMTALLRGADNARACQLIAEYDPSPPYTSGSPHKAWPETTAYVAGLIPEFNRDAIEIGRRRLGKA